MLLLYFSRKPFNCFLQIRLKIKYNFFILVHLLQCFVFCKCYLKIEKPVEGASRADEQPDNILVFRVN